MRILFFTAGTDILPSSRTRVYQYLPYLNDRGIKVKLINFTSQGLCRANLMKQPRNAIEIVFDKFYSSFQIVRLLFFASGFDVIFIQKVLLPVPVFQALKFLNKHIVFDFDDAIFLKGIYINDKFINRFIHTVSSSNLIILENDFAKDFVSKYNKNVLLITGPIDVRRYLPNKETKSNGSITIGWIGSPDTAEYLGLLSEVFRDLCLKYVNLAIHIVGAHKTNEEGTRISSSEWRLATEVEDLHKFDVGIMPLSNDSWAKGKGGYKLLQYMSCGIPCVGSPIGINLKIIREGINGFFAGSQAEWKEKLSLLIENSALRKNMGQNGRRIAVSEYSFEAFIDNFILSLKEAAL